MLKRPRAYEPLQIPFRFVDLPRDIERNGRTEPHPLRETTVFVVHGMGLQQFPETAVTLRSGFEDAIGRLSQESKDAAVPPPFIWEGYWANYALFEKTFVREWEECTERERKFFSQLWKRRSMSALRTAAWFVRTNLRQFFQLREWKKPSGFASNITVRAMAPLTILAAAAMLLRHPKLLAEVLGDVRIYCDPRGDVEMAIVHKIDERVGSAFLKLLGVDWNFQDLPRRDWIPISGTLHTFSYVTWVAHSLGTVISYNVIGDILMRAEILQQELDQRKKERERAGVSESEADRRVRWNIRRVERGLHRFVTLGSPLEKIDFFFPGVLRDWPQLALKRFGLPPKGGPKRWVNFYHVWDPVSSQLTGPRFAKFVSNRHGRLWRLPLIAHISYWRDLSILKYLVSRAYGPSLRAWRNPKFLREEFCSVLRHTTTWVTLAVVLGSFWFLYSWVSSGDALSTIWEFTKGWVAGIL